MQMKQAEYSSMLILDYEVQPWYIDCHPIWKEYEIYCNIVGAVAKLLWHRTAGAEVPGQVVLHGMGQLSRSSFNHCFTPSRSNGHLALGNPSDGTGSNS